MHRRDLLRSSLALGALAAGSLVLPDCSAWAADKPLRVGRYKGDLSYFFDLAGVRLDYPVEYYVGGAPITEALASQQLDLAGMSEIPPVFALPSNTTYKLVALMKGNPDSQVILVPDGSPLQNLGDLRGKRIGYVRATTSHYFLLRVLREQGLAWKDVTAINLSTQDGFSAFQTGQLDAWFIYGVFIQLAKFRLKARVLRNAQGYLSGNYPFGMTNTAWADPQQSARAKDYLNALQRTLDWVKAQPRAWARQSEVLTGVDAAAYLDQLDNTGSLGRILAPTRADIQSQQAVADTLFDVGAIPRQVDVSPLWDLDFLT